MINRCRPSRREDALDTEIIGPETLDALTGIASRAAAAMLAVRRQDLNQREKPDRSPVTAADEASQSVILEGLAKLLPDIPIVSEEATAQHGTAGAGRFLAVDPLDGTREFLAGRDEFVVNIALLDDGVPIAGVIAAPARGAIWRGRAGGGAERLLLSPGAAPEAARERVAIRTRMRPAIGARVMVSRSHLDAATVAYVDRLAQPARIACGSALKFCLVAEGSADLYPRLSPTSVWDTAAGHALLLAAGGAVLTPEGKPLRYSSLRVPAFIAMGDRKTALPL
jgi:3'(2'), 5'-bisphosphate nucleotidase